MRYLSAIVLAVCLSFGASFGILASGAYSPVHVSPQDEGMYNLGKALFAGNLKTGSGSACASCHTGTQALKRESLRKIRDSLGDFVARCATQQDRGNGKLDKKQMEGLLTFIRKRNRV
jgi:hypothetical protein